MSVRVRMYSAVLDDDDPRVTSIDATVGPGMPGLTLSFGSAFSEVDELGVRLRVALARCGHVLPRRARQVMLGPTGASPGIDLAAVCAVLAGHEVVAARSLADALLWGTLDQAGSLVPTPGVIDRAI